jgi:predicted transcriptional regulator
MLSYLREQGLIELMIIATSGKSRKRYVITEKGVKVHDYFEKANEVLPVEEYADLYSSQAVST